MKMMLRSAPKEDLDPLGQKLDGQPRVVVLLLLATMIVNVSNIVLKITLNG